MTRIIVYTNAGVLATEDSLICAKPYSEIQTHANVTLIPVRSKNLKGYRALFTGTCLPLGSGSKNLAYLRACKSQPDLRQR